MTHSRVSAILLASVVWTAACANGSPRSKHESSAQASAGRASGPSGNACDNKWLTEADVAGILSVPIIGMKPIPGDAQSCEFTTGGLPNITVAVRPGLGKSTVQTWLDGKMPVESTPLGGVGERAAWQPELHEVIAEKNDVLCDISVMGLAGDIRARSTDALQKRVGALCNKVFASVR